MSEDIHEKMGRHSSEIETLKDAMADGDTVRVTLLRAEKAALRAQLV